MSIRRRGTNAGSETLHFEWQFVQFSSHARARENAASDSDEVLLIISRLRRKSLQGALCLYIGSSTTNKSQCQC
jgi:hypothetical protein